jgi:predicted transcriptional regulator
MTIELTSDQEEALRQISIQSGLSMEELVHRTIDDYILFYPGHVAAIEDAQRQIERGEFLEHEEVVARINAMLGAPNR